MSSVGNSSDTSTNRQDDTVRKNREEYQNGQSSLVKKHQTEIRRLNEAHYRELERVKTDHQKQLEAYKQESQDSMSVRDHKYQQDVEDLRNLYRKQMEQIADESSKKEENLKFADTSRYDQQQEQSDSRFKKLSQDYANVMREKDRNYKENSDLSREDQARTLDKVRRQLEDENKKEATNLKLERNQTVDGLQRQYSDYRGDAENRFRNQEVRQMQENERGGNNLVRAVQRERQDRNDAEGVLREGFEAGMQAQRDRYDRAMKQNRDATGAVTDTLKARATDRIDHDIRRLENEKEDLKDLNVRQNLKNKERNRIELDNMRRAFSRNIENLEDQKNQAVHDSNDASHKDVEMVRKGLDRQIMDSNRMFREQMDERNRIDRTAIDNMKGDFESRLEGHKAIADQRVQKIYHNSEEDKMRLIELQADTHASAQREKADQIKKVHEVVDQERLDAVNRVQDQMRKQEVQHSERMAQVVNKYEKQILSLKDEMLRERKSSEETLRRTVDELQRAHKLALDQSESKNRDQLRQTNMQHGEEIRSLNKHHEEKLDQVLSEVKKT